MMKPIDMLLSYMEANRTYAAGILSKLIEIPTVNPPGENYEKIVSFLESECKSAGLKTKKYITPQGVLKRFGIKGGSRRMSLVAERVAARKRKILHINCHYDVVPAAVGKWKYPPFKAVIRGNRIYGRGSEDMKGTIASVLFALQSVKKCGVTPKINLQLSFTPDEETGGRTGLGYLVQYGFVKADYAMSEGYSQDYVSHGNKGVLWAELTVNGKASHASMPHKGVNSFERMTELTSLLMHLKKKISRRITQYHMRDPVSKSPTLVMGGVLKGGVKVNIVPGESSFSIDRRLIPEENIKDAKDEIITLIRRFNNVYKDSHVEVKFASEERPAISKKDERFFKVVSNSIRHVVGKKPKFCIMPGATDMRYFMWKGIPSLGYSAKGGETWHSDNEFVYTDSLVDTAKVYALIMSTLE